MGLFNFEKKKPDDQAIDGFWNFFKSYSPSLINGFDMAAVNKVDAELKKVCSAYKGELEFEFGKNADGSKCEFNFFHLRKPYLISVAKKLKERMPDSLKAKWDFNISA
jgi:hypothetical protein